MSILELGSVLVLATVVSLLGYVIGFNAGKKDERIVWIRWMIAQFEQLQTTWSGSPEEIVEDFLEKAL